MITPQRLPTLRIGEIWVLKVETTKLGFNWPPLPLDHPRNVLKQSVCEQFESRLGNFSKIMYEADVDSGTVSLFALTSDLTNSDQKQSETRTKEL